MRAVLCVLIPAGALLAGTAAAVPDEARLLRRPAVSTAEVAFAYGGDLWVVAREGGTARRLTETPEVETDPSFSPDGKRIAFTATVAGNTDVYLVPAKGGEPRRLTWHPGLDLVRGWSPDGRDVLFASARGVVPTPHTSSYVRLWAVSAEGGLPRALPMPRAYAGALSPGAERIAYEEFATEFETREAQRQSAQWRHYRGGRTHPIRIMELSTFDERRIPWRDSNDSDPMWVGDTVYFVSDRNFTANLFAYPVRGGEVEQLTHHDDFDVMNASAGRDAIVYEQAGFVHLLELETGRSRRVPVRIEGEFDPARPRIEGVGDEVRNAAVSRNGDAIAFEARGDLFVTSPGQENHLNLTRTSGAHDRNPAWSANDDRLAWLSDSSGEYRLIVADPETDDARSLELPRRGYYATPVWSPDGRRILLRDNHLTLWMIGTADGQAVRIDADTYDVPQRRIDPVWSPDSAWIAYARSLPNHLRAVFLYSVDAGESRQVTDAGVDAIAPAFDATGRQLFFLASTDYGRNVDWPAMSSLEQPVTRRVYRMPLRTPSPAVAAAADVDASREQIAPLDIPPADYADIAAGMPGTIFYSEQETSGLQRLLQPGSLTLWRHDLVAGERAVFAAGIDTFRVSADGRSVLYRRATDGSWHMAAAGRANGTDASEVDTGTLSVRLDPQVEWAQIFHESWRLLRDYFYQPTMHGADWPAIREKYARLVPHVRHRDDLDYLVATMAGELAVGHASVSGGSAVPDGEPAKVGMLGADVAIHDGRYRIERIYRGDPWDPAVEAPLAAANVQAGDYLIEVDGEPLLPPANVYARFAGTAGRPTHLRVGSTPGVAGSRVVTITPVEDEAPLRTYENWIEKNRRTVDRLSGGRIGYVWLPNTWVHGYRAFNRYLYSQLDKEGMIIDVRYNQGGYIPDYVVDALTRQQFGFLAMRDGNAAPMPIAGIYGPKVLLVNESSGSGGDALAYHFRSAQAGPIVGTRTWGGLVGAATRTPATLDGGGISVPNSTFYDLEGRWLIENQGVAPDIAVENTPAAVISGRDPQLERAVEKGLESLERGPAKQVPKPAPPDRVSRGAGRSPSGGS